MSAKKTGIIQSDRKTRTIVGQNDAVPIRLVHRKKSADELAITGMLGQVKEETESLLKMVEDHIETSSGNDEKGKIIS